MLTGSLGESRAIDVEVWYPADSKTWKHAPPSVYSSRLNPSVYPRPNGVLLLPRGWDPLSWEVASHVARDDAAIDSHGRFPVVVFSHGNTNAPIDYAFTLEHVASHGYIVMAPWHTGNTEDDVRVDFINVQGEGRFLEAMDIVHCSEHKSPPACSDAANLKNIADRARDVGAVLDALPSLFGKHVDATRAVAMGHSRGTVTALAAAAGSASLNISVERRVKGVLGFAIGASVLTDPLNLECGVTVPTLLVAGDRDHNSVNALSKAAFDRLGTCQGVVAADKGYVGIRNAEHRSFDSTVCAQMQSAGAIASDSNPRAVLDRNTLTGWLVNKVSGTPLDFCSYDSFVSPVLIVGVVETVTGVKVTPANVPGTGVDVDEVNRLMGELAVTFLKAVLDKRDDDRDDDGDDDDNHVSRFLSPNSLVKKEANIAWAKTTVRGVTICAPDLAAECLTK